MRHPFVRWIVAHVLACYAWVGVLSLYNAVRADDETDAVTTADEDPDEWYWRPWVWVTAAPVSVPIGLLVALMFTVASPVEHFPVAALFAMWAAYLLPMLLLFKLLNSRHAAAIDGGAPSVTLGGE